MKYIAALLSFVFGFLAFIIGMGCIELYLGILETMEIPIALEGTLEYSEMEAQLWGQNMGPAILAILCLILFSYFYSLYHRLSKKKKNTLKNDIKSPFSLYLRSFVDDAKTRKNVSFLTDIRSEEEILVDVISDIAPVYAIGDPKDKKMPLGASRVYVDDAHWKSAVMEMAQKAVVVALRLGKTDSFWWEVAMVIKNIPIEKILFIVPESKTFSNVSTLYKILLEHNINIKDLDINIEKKRRGSISSFLFFDKDGNAKTVEVKVPHFTRLLISYENILRNTLKDFRSKFGLSIKKRRSIRLARILQLLLIIFILFLGAAKMFNDHVALKYQMPYELVEECVKDLNFVTKYSNKINGTNLTWSIVESQKGTFALDDEKYLFLFMVEVQTISSLTYDEYEQIGKAPKNMLLMIKKYMPDYYENYVGILSESALLSIRNPDEIKELISLYKSSLETLPQWIIDLSNSEENWASEYEHASKINDIILKHIKDKGIADVIKILSSQNINLK